jgi:hypothetical protein
VTEFKFDRNESAVALLPQTLISSSNFPALLAERTVTSTTFGATAMSVRTTTNGDMSADFGTAMVFQIRDNAGIDNNIARIIAMRSGADNSGRVIFNTVNAGTETEKMTIMPNGNVGIGITNPATKLEVAGGGRFSGFAIGGQIDVATPNLALGFALTKADTSRADMRYESGRLSFALRGVGSGIPSERMVITEGGNVGIGTTSPASKLSVITSSNTDGLQIRRNSGSTNATSVLGFISTTVDTSENFAEIRSVRTNRAVSGDTKLSFHTNSNNTLAERMTIRDDGNVGIGTTAPVMKLGIATDTNDDGLQIRRNANSSTSFALLAFRINTLESQSANYVELRAVRTNRATATDTELQFLTRGNNTLSQKMVIRDDGLVGINETSLTAQLQVKSGATSRVPLTVDTLASQTANLQEWKVNGGTLAFVTNLGRIATNLGIGSGTANNAYVNTPTTGVVISRNIADSNPALIVNLANASATSDITRFQKAGTTLSTIANNGVFVGQARPTRTDITANATLALVDEGKVLRVNSASNLTITIPLNASVAFPIDTEIAVLRYGEGTVAISPTAGVELNSINDEREIKGQFGSVALKKIDTDEWVLVGSLEA